MSVVGDGSFAVRYYSAGKGHLAVTKLLVKAGSDLETKNYFVRSAPLGAAAEQEKSVVSAD